MMARARGTAEPGRADDGDIGMRAFWDAKARENAMYFIHNQLEYTDVDEEEFWRSGQENLDRTLAPFGVTVGSGDEILEIGCGIGRMTRALAARGRHVTGVDVSVEMIEQGRAALADLDNVELHVGNGRDLSEIADASIDVVYSFIVFQHIPDPEVTCGYIREIGRVLRPGGWTVFQVSERPEIHRPEAWRGQGLRNWLRRLRGRSPKGLFAPQWLGSALGHDQLLGALAGGGLELAGVIGEGTQFCLVHARRAGTAGS